MKRVKKAVRAKIDEERAKKRHFSRFSTSACTFQMITRQEQNFEQD